MLDVRDSGLPLFVVSLTICVPLGGATAHIMASHSAVPPFDYVTQCLAEARPALCVNWFGKCNALSSRLLFRPVAVFFAVLPSPRWWRHLWSMSELVYKAGEYVTVLCARHPPASLAISRDQKILKDWWKRVKVRDEGWSLQTFRTQGS